MKRKILSLILVFAMTVSLLTVGTGAVEPTYGDTAGHWAEDSIERWSGHGIIQGSNGEFDPNGQLTCAQLATILAKLLKLPAAKDAGFTDNAANAWYYDAINRCAAAGILNGNGDGTVTPDAPISRERAIVMLGRALGIEPISKPNLTKYTDAAKVAPYAQGMVAAMIEAGIVGGVTADELAPQDNINRASTVTILDRAIDTYADKAGETVKADGKGIVLVVADDVTVTGDVDKLLVPADNVDVTVSGSKNIDDITVTGDNSKVILNNSTANDVTLSGANTEVETKGSSKVENVSVTEDAKGATVNAGSGTTVKNVENSAADTTVTGSGSVKNVASDTDVTVETKGTEVKNTGDEKITVTDKNGKTTETTSGGSSTTTGGSTSSGGSSSGGSSTPSHSHVWATEWSHDETHHWHECSAANCTVSSDEGKDGYAAHTFTYADNGDGTHTKSCSICGYSATEAHSYGDDNKCVCGLDKPADGVLASVMQADGTYAYYTSVQDAINAATDGAIVKLLGNVTGQVVIPAEKTITLDLDEKTITHSGTAIINNGTLIVKNGAVVSTGNCGIGVGSNSETTIESSVTVTAQESAVITSTSTGAKIYIEGGLFTSRDNAVIAGNGSERGGKPNTIIIKNGIFNGGITSEGFVACGIYAPWKDEITVKGGTFNITGGAGIVARAGQVTVEGDAKFICTGNVTGKVGDSRVVVPCAALVFDSEANYPALTGESVILVKSGSFTVQSGDVAKAVKTEDDLNKRISIKGGSFSGDPGEYVANGYGVKNENGVYTVTEPAAAINGKKYATLAAAINAAQSGETVTLLRDAIGSGISTPDQGTSRESLTIDFGGHTYTVENPGVGSRGTETQAMHWGRTLGKITLKNGTLNVAQGATDVAMAMQNYINLDAEDMVLDFTNITVVHYAEDEFESGSKWVKYNGKECPMFNNNDENTEIKLTRCIVTLPDDSTLGGNINGTLTLVDSTFNGYLCFNSTDGRITVDSGSSIKGDQVRSYFDGELNIVCNDGVWTATETEG